MNKQDLDRHTGRTYALLNFVADCIQDGQPEAVVVFATQREIYHNILLFLEFMKRRGLAFSVINHRQEIQMEGSRILFVSLAQYPKCMYGRSPCEFIDHYAYVNMTSEQLHYAERV